MSRLRHHGTPGLHAEKKVSTVNTAASASEIGMLLRKVSPTLPAIPRNSSIISRPSFVVVLRRIRAGAR